jgi:hypothetical protein
VNVVFPDVLRGTTFTIRLIVKRKHNNRSFHNDDGIDTVTRRLYFVRYNEPLSWEGTYYGSDDDKPDSMYTILLGHSYNEVQKQDFIKVFGIPRGCKDTVNERFSLPIINYTNVAFDRNGIDCDAKVVLGVFKNGNQYHVRHQFKYLNNNGLIRIYRTFTGIKIN